MQVAFKRNILDLHPTQDASKWQTQFLFDPLAIPEPDVIILVVTGSPGGRSKSYCRLNGATLV